MKRTHRLYNLNQIWLFYALAGILLWNSPVMSQNLIQYVNCFSGTSGGGNTFPGPVTPFGMIQWSPDTRTGGNPSGYSYNDDRICQFSLDHLSGAGCTYGEDFGFMPISGGMPPIPPNGRGAFPSPFSHADETARPGYYSVTLNNGVKVELTSTTRAAFGRFTYPSGSTETMMINAASGGPGVRFAQIHVDPKGHEVSGSAVGKPFCGYDVRTKVYFYAVFNRPFASYSTWSGNVLAQGAADAQGNAAGAFITFNHSAGSVLLVRVSISYVSVENAKANLEAEIPDSRFTSKGFDEVKASTGDVWNSWLKRIEVKGGTRAEMRTFYSMLYHALLGPTICSDVNGECMGYDGKVHTTNGKGVQYANFSGWDVYRSECQMLAMIAPGHASDMAQSLLRDYQQGGAFPRWGVPNTDTGVMNGDPAAVMIPDFYAFGARSFDVEDAFKGLYRVATVPGLHQEGTEIYERGDLADYMKLGYIPEYPPHDEGPAATTLECCSADFALSQLAKQLGHSSESEMLLERAQNWKNLYNPVTGYIEMKRRDGSWAPDFTNGNEFYNNFRAYVEGTASQYVWMVPFNLKGLADKMGGTKAAASRLDKFFTKLNDGTSSVYAYMGNEPCLETPWEYDFFNEPYKTQEIVRKIMTKLYSSVTVGYPGNDDLGEMSSWYIFAALGMYPELPGSDVLVLGSPLFKEAVLHLKNGNVTIEGKDASVNSPYVHSLMVNGKRWNKPWIRFRDISHGGSLVFCLTNVPDRKWGGAPSDAPPSYGG